VEFTGGYKKSVMKDILKIGIFSFLLTVLMQGCKKSNTPPAIDYASFIKNKTWWGTLTNTGLPMEHYSVHFNADNSLKWNQMAGEYDGQWVITGKHLIMTFNSLGVDINADISKDGKLENITDNNNNSTINTGELIVNTDFPLDNTVWKGSIFFGSSATLQMKFTPGYNVEITIANSLVFQYVYKRPAPGAYIRATPSGTNANQFFGVLVSANEMKGSYLSSLNYWQMIKQ
jgi:hypothetical protein